MATSRWRHIAGVAVVIVALGACGKGESEKLAQTSSGSTGDQPTTSTTHAGSTTIEGHPTTSRAGAATKGAVLGSADAQIAASPADPTPVSVRLDLFSMERLAGDLVEARFRITNTGNGADLVPFFSFSRGTSYNTSGAAIIDLQGSRRYEALQDTGGRCLCSDIPIMARIPPGGSADYYARFGTPPTDVTTVDFELPGFPPLRSVPLR